jgi:hypothetical protein
MIIIKEDLARVSLGDLKGHSFSFADELWDILCSYINIPKNKYTEVSIEDYEISITLIDNYDNESYFRIEGSRTLAVEEEEQIRIAEEKQLSQVLLNEDKRRYELYCTLKKEFEKE